jgi:hypothetical protein
MPTSLPSFKSDRTSDQLHDNNISSSTSYISSPASTAFSDKPSPPTYIVEGIPRPSGPGHVPGAESMPSDQPFQFRHPPLKRDHSFGKVKEIASSVANALLIKNTPLESKSIRSKFSSWTRVQLIEILVSHNVELRCESIISYSSLRELADEVCRCIPLFRFQINKFYFASL